MAKIYKTNGEIVEVNPKNGTDFKLEELKEVVEGYIEMVYLSSDKIMFVNEEGKLLGLDYNENATRIFREAHPDCDDFIAGNAIVTNSNEVD